MRELEIEKIYKKATAIFAKDRKLNMCPLSKTTSKTIQSNRCLKFARSTITEKIEKCQKEG